VSFVQSQKRTGQSFVLDMLEKTKRVRANLMTPELVKQYQEMIHKIAVRYKHCFHDFELQDVEQELWVWLLDLLKINPGYDYIDLYHLLAVEVRRHLRIPYMRPERIATGDLRQRAEIAWHEYLSTLAHPDRTIMTLSKLKYTPEQIMERIGMSRYDVVQTKYALIQNFKVYLRRYLERQ